MQVQVNSGEAKQMDRPLANTLHFQKLLHSDCSGSATECNPQWRSSLHGPSNRMAPAPTMKGALILSEN